MKRRKSLLNFVVVAVMLFAFAASSVASYAADGVKVMQSIASEETVKAYVQGFTGSAQEISRLRILRLIIFLRILPI